MRAEPLLADPVPAIVRIGNVRSEPAKGRLVGADGRVAQLVDRAQIPEILLDMGRRPVPGKLVHMIHEPPNAGDALIDRVELKVPGQLLVAPAREHVLQRLLLGMQQLNSTQLQHTPGPIDRHYAPQTHTQNLNQ